MAVARPHAADDPRVLRAVIEWAPDAIVVADEAGCLVLANARAEELFGHRGEELVGRALEDLLPGLGTGKAQVARNAAGIEVPVDATMTTLATEAGTFLTAVVRRDEQHLRHQASHDGLTGLANRSTFEVELRRCAAVARRYGGGAVLLLDLDGFKAVNDELGHAEGDRVLRGVAGAIRRRLRTTDLVARYGGDEIVVLLPRADAEEAARAAEALREVVRQDGTVTASIGVALLERHERPQAALEAADRAMYDAKRAGGDAVAIAAEPAT